MKLVTSEQLKINRESKNYEVLQKLHNTIDLKDYYAKIISKINAGGSFSFIKSKQ